LSFGIDGDYCVDFAVFFVAALFFVCRFIHCQL
jgi:hypothetical protein